MSVWLESKQAAALLGISKQALLRKKEKYSFRKIPHPGYDKVEFELKSLGDVAIYNYKESEVVTAKADLSDYTTEGISPKNRELALAKYSVIKEWKEFRENFNGKAKRADEIFINSWKEEHPLLFSKLKGKLSIKTLYRDSKKLEESNYDWRSLVPNWKPPVSSISEIEEECLIKYIKYPTKLLLAEIIRLAIRDLNDMNFEGIKSESTYRNWINDWKSKNYDLWTFFREGEKALRDKVMPPILRNKKLVNVGDASFLDGHVTNFEILDELGKPRRMTLLTVHDMRSDMMIGWEIMLTENKYMIANAVRRSMIFMANALGFNGMAFKGKIVGIDNGKAFKSNYLLGVKSELEGLFKMFFDDAYIAKPYNASVKPNERFYRTFSELERRMLAYTGTSIENKPPRMLRNEKLHKQVFDKLNQNHALTIEDAHFMIAEWMEEYSERKHQGGIDKGRTPIEIFNEGLEMIKSEPDFKKRLIPATALNILMLETKVVTKYTSGIRLFGEYYNHNNLYSYEVGKGGVEFIIKYDRFQNDSILVYDKDMNFICEASKTELMHPISKLASAEQREKIKAAIENQNSLVQRTQSIFKQHFEEQIKNDLPKVKAEMNQKLNKNTKPEREISSGQDLDLYIPRAANSDLDDEPDFDI